MAAQQPLTSARASLPAATNDLPSSRELHLVELLSSGVGREQPAEGPPPRKWT